MQKNDRILEQMLHRNEEDDEVKLAQERETRLMEAELEEETRLKRELATRENNRRINPGKWFSLSYQRRPRASLLPTLNTGIRHPLNSQCPPQASLLPPTMARGTVIRVYVRDIVGSTFSNVGNNNSNGSYGTLHLILSILLLIYFFLILSRE